MAMACAQKTDLIRLFWILIVLICSFYVIQTMDQFGSSSFIEKERRKNMKNMFTNVRKGHNIVNHVDEAKLRDINNVGKRKKAIFTNDVSGGPPFIKKKYTGTDNTKKSHEFKAHINEAIDTKYPPWAVVPRNESNLKVETCPPIVRKNYMNKVCKTIMGHKKKAFAPYLLVEDSRAESQTAGCIPWKAGTNSWRMYMGQGIYKLKDYLKDIPMCGGTLARCGHSNSSLRHATKVAIKQLVADDYIRYIIARHPLQRLVSAYFEEFARAAITKTDGSKMSFADYIEAITSNLIDGNAHWVRYTTFCALCDVGYDFVVRTETVDSDIVSFNTEIGIHENVTVDHLHFGKSKELVGKVDKKSNYKYDSMLKMLQQEHPALMRRLLATYKDDMSVLGYHWDWDNGKSSCWIKHNGHVCC